MENSCGEPCGEQIDDRDPVAYPALLTDMASSADISESTEAKIAEQGRTRSTIAFPYSPLKDAETIAVALQDQWGGTATPEQLAAGLAASPRSGAFRNKITAARIFGGVDVSRGHVALTDLGRRLVDPDRRRAARVEAFLNVPLFSELYERYKGALLPPDSGLEREVVRLGVGQKQKERARWTFQKSAELAGFFEHGRNRLVLPASADGAGREGGEGKGDVAAGDERSMPAYPQRSALEALWMTLLRDGAAWTPEQIAEYVGAARRVYQVLGEPD